MVLGDDDPLGSSVFRTTGSSIRIRIRIRIRIQEYWALYFSLFKLATDNAARPSELVNRAYELRSLIIDRR